MVKQTPLNIERESLEDVAGKRPRFSLDDDNDMFSNFIPRLCTSLGRHFGLK